MNNTKSEGWGSQIAYWKGNHKNLWGKIYLHQQSWWRQIYALCTVPNQTSLNSSKSKRTWQTNRPPSQDFYNKKKKKKKSELKSSFIKNVTVLILFFFFIVTTQSGFKRNKRIKEGIIANAAQASQEELLKVPSWFCACLWRTCPRSPKGESP